MPIVFPLSPSTSYLSTISCSFFFLSFTLIPFSLGRDTFYCLPPLWLPFVVVVGACSCRTLSSQRSAEVTAANPVFALPKWLAVGSSHLDKTIPICHPRGAASCTDLSSLFLLSFSTSRISIPCMYRMSVM